MFLSGRRRLASRLLWLVLVWSFWAPSATWAASYRPATAAERRSLSEVVFVGRVAGLTQGAGGGIAVEVEKQITGRLPPRVLLRDSGPAGREQAGVWNRGESPLAAGARYLFHAIVQPDGRLTPVGPPEPERRSDTAVARPETEILRGARDPVVAEVHAAHSHPVAAGLTGISIPADAEPLPSRLVKGDAGQKIPYRVDATAWPAGLSLDEVLSAVARAFAAWEEATGLRFYLDAIEDFETAADAIRSGDGMIRIQMHDLYGRIDDPLALAFGGLFAAGGPLGFGHGGRVWDQEFHQTTDGYVIVNHRQAVLSNLPTLEEVLAHEIGHTLGLAHSSDSLDEEDPERVEALMYFQVHADGRGARLAEWDRQAVRRAYPEDSFPPAAFSGVHHAVTVAGGSEHRLPELLRMPVHRGSPGISSDGAPWSVRLFPATTATHGEFIAEGGDIAYHPLGFFEKATLAGSNGSFYDRAVYRIETGTHASAVETMRVLSLGRDGWHEAPDGLPDIWVERWFGAGSVVDPEGDSDGDGCREHVEFQQDTDPGDPGSCVQVDFTVGAMTVAESEAEFELELRCTQPPVRPLAVRWSWSGSARLGEDYAVPEGYVMGAVLPAGVTRWIIPVRLIEDELSEGRESVELEISAVEGAALGPVPRIEVTIEDDEELPVYRFADSTYRTGEGSAEQLLVTVLRSGRTDVASCVSVRIRGGENDVSFSPEEDFGTVGWEVCFAEGETVATVAIVPVDDETQEPEETGTLELSVLEGGGIVETNGTEALLTVEDNDGAPQVALSAEDARENASHAEVHARLSHPSRFPVVLSYALRDGSAKAGEDYLSQSGAIVVSPGELVGIARIALIDDGWSENVEEFHLVVTAVENAEAELRELSIRLLDDEDKPGLRLPARIEATEGEAVRVSASLTGPSAVAVEFSWQLTARTAATRDDVPAEGGILRFLPGETSAQLEWTLPDDAIDEPVESVYLEVTGHLHAQPGPFVTEVVLADNDPRPILRVEDFSVSESVGVARFPVRLSGPSDFEITVQLSTGGGTATPGADYGAASGTLVLPPGAVEAFWEILVIDDSLAEPEETFDVRLGLVRHATVDQTTAHVAILDDDFADLPDLPGVLTVRADPVIEGYAAKLWISRSTPSHAPTVVRYRTRAETAQAPEDFAETVGEAVIASGESSVLVEIQVAPDLIDEEDETFLLDIFDSGGLMMAGEPFRLTILDDDDPPELSVATLPAAEGAGPSEVLLRLSEVSGRRVEGRIVAVGGTATAGEDYFFPESSFSMAPGETETVIAVTILEDLRTEETETVVFDLDDLMGVSGSGVPFTLVITDNEILPSEGSLELETGGRRNPEFRWRGREGGRYQVERSRDLREWQELLPSARVATGFWESLPLPDETPGHPVHFLRLARLAAEDRDE